MQGRRKMRALGIDPGTALCGYGIIDKDGPSLRVLDYGVIETVPSMGMDERLEIVFTGLNQLLEEYRPQIVGVEELFFNRNITTAITVAQARGVILLAGRLAGVPIYECTPLQVKQQVVGYGRATKKQVIDMTMQMLHIEEKISPDDAADALAIGLTAIYRTENESVYGRIWRS